MKEFLRRTIAEIEKLGGKCDTVVVGTDAQALLARQVLAELGRDFNVIADDEIGTHSVWVCHSEDLAKFKGGGQN